MDPKLLPGQKLTSWKQIAQYFGREVRTVQRWGKEEWLPVPLPGWLCTGAQGPCRQPLSTLSPLRAPPRRGI